MTGHEVNIRFVKIEERELEGKGKREERTDGKCGADDHRSEADKHRRVIVWCPAFFPYVRSHSTTQVA